MRFFMSVIGFLSVLVLLIACSNETVEPESTPSAPVTDTCTAKCDGLADQVTDLYSDMRRLNLDDLVSLGAGMATQELNQQLANLPYVDLKLSPTALFGPNPRELFGNVMIQSIVDLQQGLTQGLGENAFATQINELRMATLSQGAEEIFAETSFKIDANLRHQWSLNHGDMLGDLGFYADPSLEASVIAPYKEISEAVYNNPLQTLLAAQNFILPTRLEDVLSMKPGSSVMLRGAGAIGFNIGLGVPLIASAVAQYITLHARLSAGARASLQGQLDVQLVRGAENTVFVDVGMSTEKIKHFSVALDSGWGVEGLPVYELDVAGVKVNLTDVVESSLEKQLNQHLSPFDARKSNGSSEGRLTVARFYFDLTNASSELEQALYQSMKGDIRLAQALANRQNTNVTQLVDLNKEYQKENDYLGFRFLSMRFFKSMSVNQGLIHIEENGENQELLYKEIEEKSGFFFTERGSKWRQLTSIRSINQEVIDTQNNARLIILEHDRFLGKDQILDHIDPLLAYFLGFDNVFNRVGLVSDQLFEYVDHSCGHKPDNNDDRFEERREMEAYEKCVADLATTETFKNLSEQIYQEAYNIQDLPLKTDFDDAFGSTSEMMRKILDLKVGISSIHDPSNAFLRGPRGTLISQIRFSDPAIQTLMSEEAPERFRTALEKVLMLMHADRGDDMDDKIDEMEDFVNSRTRFIDPIVDTYQKFTYKFDQYQRISQLSFAKDQPIGNAAQLLMIPTNNLSESTIHSIAHLKGDLLGQFFQQLTQSARSLREPDQFVLAYALLALTEAKDIELMVNYQFDEKHDQRYDRYNTHIYSRGTSPFINAGQFNLDDLINAE
jgi:hypothetical protein